MAKIISLESRRVEHAKRLRQRALAGFPWNELMEYTVAEDARASVDTLLVDGANAVLMGHLSGTVRATGKSFEGPFALHLAVENGRIMRHRLYENSLSIAQACAP